MVHPAMNANEMPAADPFRPDSDTDGRIHAPCRSRIPHPPSGPARGKRSAFIEAVAELMEMAAVHAPENSGSDGD